MASDNATPQPTLSTTWDVLGPFPIHAREQHLLSPSFPLDLRNEPCVDPDAIYPSSYADNGTISWSTTTLSADGSLKVSFPNIRWQALRATEGWAALQHHALLHGTLTVPEDATHHRLLVSLIQGAYFTILPRGRLGLEPQWYAGNIYDLSASQPQSVPIEPGEYDIWVAGDYEIRLFGDPGDGVPIQSLRLTVELESIAEPSVQAVPTHHVYPDFLDGLAFGEAIGFGVRSIAGWWSVADVALKTSVSGLSLTLVLPNATLAPSQTRIIPIRLSQTEPLPTDSAHDRELYGPLTAETVTLSFSIPITKTGKYIKGTYLYSGTMPTAFYAIPPASSDLALQGPVLLALHGAGVDIFSTTFWQDALPRVEKHWTVVPSGRTSWVRFPCLFLLSPFKSFFLLSFIFFGLDWHGSSALDAWRSFDALVDIVKARNIAVRTNPIAVDAKPKALLVGHSNGGQGAWYLASRFPDRVIGVVAAAAYIKSQAYVSLGMGRGAHYADPALNGILDASFAADDNDLFLTNLADIPIYAIHGGADENVPVWHTRELVSTLKTLNPKADVTYREDPGQPHWYDGIFDERVDAFIDRVLSSPTALAAPASPYSKAIERFTLTVASPTESGTLHGWAVEELAVPGRLAKLSVARTIPGRVDVKTQNVAAFTVDKDVFEHLREVTINGKEVELRGLAKGTMRARFSFKNKEWDQDDEHHPRQPLRAQSILSTAHGPIKVSVPSLAPDSPELSLALRIVHDLDTYHKLDAEIIEGRPNDRSSLVAIQVGKPSDAYCRLLEDDSAVLLPRADGVCFRGKKEHRVHKPGTGVIALDPNVVDGRTKIYLYAADVAGLERLGRLFPIRTGVKVPGWMVVGPEMDTKSSGGILGAGFFGTGGEWNVGMSWFSE
uniref:Peptidase S9 prolyl oligopeptidase catalytic domain-containing protein n=1 Tax=Schizophyllum commune (strain H4-8 / FGSC 9210) TaxID=578458 RepID=D8PW24_SCHCM